MKKQATKRDIFVKIAYSSHEHICLLCVLEIKSRNKE